MNTFSCKVCGVSHHPCNETLIIAGWLCTNWLLYVAKDYKICHYVDVLKLLKSVIIRVGFKEAVVAQSLKTKTLVTFCVAFSIHDIRYPVLQQKYEIIKINK